jgi:NAD(P)-dependent dehydrogenase (short-subunit alcohol dehydrogenase family)
MKRESIRIAVIDGQGGGLGRALVEQVRRANPDISIRALGTNAAATAAMLKGGADDGATGENAIVFNAARMQILLGPVGILAANGLLGEVTPAMAEAVGAGDALKILLPSAKCNIRLAIGGKESMQTYLNEAVRLCNEEIARLSNQ